MDGVRERIVGRARCAGEAESATSAVNGLHAGVAVRLPDAETFKHRLMEELGEIRDRVDQIGIDLNRLAHGIEPDAAAHRLANRGAEPSSEADAEQIAAIEGRN